MCEATDRLGGQFLTAGEAPRKEEMKQAVIAMAHQAEKLGVEIRLNTPVTPELIKEIHPHTVINAIGAVPIIPNIPGADLPFMLIPRDVLDGTQTASGNVVVIGGGMVGMEVAEYLVEKGCKVTDLKCQRVLRRYGKREKTCVTESVYAMGITPVTEVTGDRSKDGMVIGKRTARL